MEEYSTASNVQGKTRMGVSDNGNPVEARSSGSIENKPTDEMLVSHLSGASSTKGKTSKEQKNTTSAMIDSFSTSSSELSVLKTSSQKQNKDVWNLAALQEVRDQLEGLNQDTCMVLHVGCYYLMSSLQDDDEKKLLLARHNKLNRVFAIEMKNKDSYEKCWDSEIWFRNRIQRKNMSPFIVRYKESFQTHGHAFFVREYMECGDLESRMKDSPFTDAQSLFYSCCVLLALAYLHKIKIAHRNISLKCCYLSALGIVKLCDFSKAQHHPNLKEDMARDAYKDIKAWAVCLESMIHGKVLTEPSNDIILTIDDQNVQDLLIKVFERAILIDKCPFVLTIPPNDVSSALRICKHPAFKSFNMPLFKKGVAISPDLHQIVIKEKVCPLEQWRRICEANISETQLNEITYPKQFLWIKPLDDKLKDYIVKT